MADKNKKKVETTVPPVADNAVEAAPQQDIVTDRKTPKAVYREEVQRTVQVTEDLGQEYQAAKETTKTKKAVKVKNLENLRVKLDSDIAKQFKPTVEQVASLTETVYTARDAIIKLEKELEQRRKLNSQNLKSLVEAETLLEKQSRPLERQYHKDCKEEVKVRGYEIVWAQKQEKASRKKMKKGIRLEKRATVKNTVKGTVSYAFGMVAAIPDVVVKAVRSAIGMVKELGKTFNRVATRGGKDYKKSTRFSKLRNKPGA